MTEVHYRIERDADDLADGETHPWHVHVYRAGQWVGACLYRTGAEALAQYDAETRTP